MKRYLAILTFFLCATAYAQSDPITPGLIEAESSALQPYYSGSGWVQVIDGAYSVMESSEAGDSVSFTVADTRQIVIYRELLATGGGTVQICVESLCGTFTNTSSTDQKGIPVSYPVSDGDTVTLTNQDGGTIRIDSFLLFAAPELTEVPAPDPVRRYVTLEDGTVAAVDQVISGGDLLILGFMAGIATLLIVVIVLLAWHEGS